MVQDGLMCSEMGNQCYLGRRVWKVVMMRRHEECCSRSLNSLEHTFLSVGISQMLFKKHVVLRQFVPLVLLID